ncbi:MAG: hypothetical protein OXC44_04920 [Proteobacteria bacterium]|nr:hypothetical protein [Pseudomonadota bacterium]
MNWQQLKEFDQITPKSIHLHKNNANELITISTAILVTIAILRLKFKERTIGNFALVISPFSLVALGVGIGDKIKTLDAMRKYNKKKSSQNLEAVWALNNSINFSALAKENEITHSDEYIYLQNIMDSLGSRTNEYLDGISIDGNFYKSFAGLLQKLGLTKNNEIVAYCRMFQTKSCNPI